MRTGTRTEGQGQKDRYRDRDRETGTEGQGQRDRDRGTGTEGQGQRERTEEHAGSVIRTGTWMGDISTACVPLSFMQARGDCTTEHLKVGILRKTPAYLYSQWSGYEATVPRVEYNFSSFSP